MRSKYLPLERVDKHKSPFNSNKSEFEVSQTTSIISKKLQRAPTLNLFEKKSIENPKILKKAFSEILPKTNTDKVKSL